MRTRCGPKALPVDCDNELLTLYRLIITMLLDVRFALFETVRGQVNLSVREDKQRGVYVAGATEEYVTSADEVIDGCVPQKIIVVAKNSHRRISVTVANVYDPGRSIGRSVGRSVGRSYTVHDWRLRAANLQCRAFVAFFLFPLVRSCEQIA